jgi:tetratricopeptide (TPR) repeat protein
MRAVEDFTRALALNPNILGAIVGRGWSYVALKRYSEASAEFERALALDPNNVFALNGKAEAQQHPVGAGRLKTLIHEVFT